MTSTSNNNNAYPEPPAFEHHHHLPTTAQHDTNDLSEVVVFGRILTCTLCNRSFDRPSSYTVHMRTHTGERPFDCHLCGKGFGVRSNLTRHMRTTHAGEWHGEDDEGVGGEE